MRKKTTLGILSVLALAVTIGVAALLPALTADAASNALINSGAGGYVTLTLPPAANQTSPPAAPGSPTRPSAFQLRPYYLTSSSYDVSHNAMIVYLWMPQRSSYNAVALITTGNNIEMEKKLWNNTFIWYNTTGNSAANLLNVIKVNPDDFMICIQNLNGQIKNPNNAGQKDILITNLSRTVHISLPFNLWPQPTQALGNLTFDLPPIIMTFRPIAPGFVDEGANFPLPSGYSYLPVALNRMPAWAEVRIPSWLGAGSPLEISGHFDLGYSQTFTPPAT